ncbi:hypothetical protein AAFF_G00253550 [Aldrovandia affinis]|uniref:Uncharacterized protein n=1 Tax=Aldrovandia affinis TaxID=143900 RepID=A0AAD7WTS4_9TELE|nr:hypothetical protein AAFF_G00253550 [Aldrovandia affinis]
MIDRCSLIPKALCGFRPIINGRRVPDLSAKRQRVRDTQGPVRMITHTERVEPKNPEVVCKATMVQRCQIIAEALTLSAEQTYRQ